MKRRKRERAWEAVKSAAIVALSLSAIYLALRSQLSANLPGGTVSGWVASLVKPEAAAGTEERTDRAVDLKPLRMAVNLRGEGRYGVQYDQAAVDALYAETAGLLRDCLDSAGTPQRVSEQVWRTALSQRTGVYFDFQGSIPPEVLRASLSLGDTASGSAGGTLRRLLLAEDAEGTVLLYYSNESEGSYYACSTSEALRGHLQSTLAGYGANGARFAFEGDYEGLDPYVLVTGPGGAEVYAVSSPVAGMDEGRDALLEALSFHPQSSSSYPSGASLVVSEWPDRLTISDNGRVSYETTPGESPKYPVGGEGGLDAAQVAQVTQHLAAKTMGRWMGEGRLYLMGVELGDDGTWRADYGYCLNGIPVERGDGGYAARFEVRDGQVTAYTMDLRTYASTGTRSIVLPEVQAAAAMKALGAAGGELQLVYEDSGVGQLVEVLWVAEK